MAGNRKVQKETIDIEAMDKCFNTLKFVGIRAIIQNKLIQSSAPSCILDGQKGILDRALRGFYEVWCEISKINEIDFKNIASKTCPCYFCGNYIATDMNDTEIIEIEGKMEEVTKDDKCKINHSMDYGEVEKRRINGCVDYDGANTQEAVEDIESQNRSISEDYSDQNILKAFQYVGLCMSKYQNDKKDMKVSDG